MSYDKVPWDDSKKGIDRVKEIRRFLLSDASSVVRSSTQKDIRVAWNGGPGSTKTDLCVIEISQYKVRNASAQLH
jgi:hypothetical protein